MSIGGPKESDNRDKSLYGLMVALTIVGVIAGSVILFAYATSDPVTYVNATTETEQVSAHNEVEIKESLNGSESEVEPSSETPEQTEDEDEKEDKDNGNKGKGYKDDDD